MFNGIKKRFFRLPRESLPPPPQIHTNEKEEEEIDNLHIL
jgi:hypothetical protein